jgi:Alpha-(1,6)-fucosyltransferase N- and catalytic domains
MRIYLAIAVLLVLIFIFVASGTTLYYSRRESRQSKFFKKHNSSEYLNTSVSLSWILNSCDDHAINNAKLVAAGSVGVKKLFDSKSFHSNISLDVEMMQQLWSEIEQNQRPPDGDCKKARLLSVEYPANGFASGFGIIAGALIQAYLRKRVLIFQEGSNWPYYPGKDECPTAHETKWECFFESIGPCNEANSREPGEGGKNIGDDDGSTTGGHRILDMSIANTGFYYHDSLTTMKIPSPYDSLGPAWFRTQFFLFLFRLNANTIDALKDRMIFSKIYPLPPKYLSWHVRHGDKVVEKHKTFEIDEFMPRVIAAAAKLGTKNIFLSSDDPNVISNAQSAFEDFRLFSLVDYMRIGDSASAEAASVARNEKDKTLGLAYDALFNLWLMSEGNGFAGIFHSNFGRLAAEFMYAKGRPMIEYEWQDKGVCDGAGHNHPDRDAYFDARSRGYLSRRRWSE